MDVGVQPMVPTDEGSGGGAPDPVAGIVGWRWAHTRLAGEHWDVQHPNFDHTNVSSKGKVRGDDLFPNKPR